MANDDEWFVVRIKSTDLTQFFPKQGCHEGIGVTCGIAIEPDLVVLLSGVVEILLGTSLIFLSKYRSIVGWIVALFFVAVFPGNIAQLVNHKDAFGLNSDLLRWLRLPFQPILIALVLWSTGAWAKWRNKSN